MIRWHLQEGRSAIPKSVRAERIAENFDVFGFELTAEELKVLDTLDTGVAAAPNPTRSPWRTSAAPSPKPDQSSPQPVGLERGAPTAQQTRP